MLWESTSLPGEEILPFGRAIGRRSGHEMPSFCSAKTPPMFAASMIDCTPAGAAGPGVGGTHLMPTL